MFSLSSSKASPTQQPDPSARLSRRTTRSDKIITVAAVALLTTANTFASAAENPKRTAREHHTPVPSSWGSINRETSTTHASEASKRPCLSWIKPNWFRRIEPHALEKGSSLIRRLSQSAL